MSVQTVKYVELWVENNFQVKTEFFFRAKKSKAFFSAFQWDRIACNIERGPCTLDISLLPLWSKMHGSEYLDILQFI